MDVFPARRAGKGHPRSPCSVGQALKSAVSNKWTKMKGIFPLEKQLLGVSCWLIYTLVI